MELSGSCYRRVVELLRVMLQLLSKTRESKTDVYKSREELTERRARAIVQLAELSSSSQQQLLRYVNSQLVSLNIAMNSRRRDE